MDKLLIFPGKTEKGIFTHVIDSERPFLEKTAAEYHPKIAEYIRNAKTVPGKTQILLTALGAGEYWGSNVNGDYFPEEALAHEGTDYGHKTFETMAKIYKHHVNKDPAASFGDVALSVYNPVYRRVELIVVLDNAKAPDIAEKIENGEYPDWSMGCRVPWDECSICGNRAPTVKQYCEHLRYYMNRIHPGSGKQAYAINRQPRFFDISQVIIGADRIAKTLEKVASAERRFLGSAELAEKVAVVDKAATIKKEIPASGAPSSQESVQTLVRAIPEVKALEPEIPTEVLDDVARRYSLPEVMSTLSVLGIIPKPQEFQRIILIRAGKKDLADELSSKNICFDPSMCEEPSEEHAKILGLKEDKFHPEIMNIMSRFMADRSYAAPHLLKRITVIEKYAAEKHIPKIPLFFDPEGSNVDARTRVGIFPLMMLASGLYAAMTKKSPELAVTSVQKLIAKNPGLAAALGAAAPMIFNSVFGEGSSHPHPEYNEPEIERIGQHLDSLRMRPFQKHASVSAGLGRMFLGVPAVYMASGILQKSKNYHPDKEESKITRFIRRNPDIIGAAVALDSVLAMSGKGTHGLIKKMPFIKKASDAGDFAMDSMVWPLAFGGKGLMGRMVGGMVDQAVLAGSKKLLSKKKSQDKV